MAFFGRGVKRRAAVRCAAANDDDYGDLGGLFDVARERASASSSSAGAARVGKAEASAAADADKDKPRKKKAKEFAWMDSDDDDDNGDGAADSDKEETPGPGSGGGGGEEESQPITVEALDEVQSFGRMMLLSDALRAQLRGPALGADGVAAACRALARSKFFDRDLLDDLYDVIKRLLKESRFEPPHVHDAVLCLHTLNAYDADLCSTIARCYLSRVGELEARIRNEWLDIFRFFNHSAEPSFLQLLEVPPVAPMHPSYKKVRCRHHSRGTCAIGDACTYSHDPRAPLSLSDHTNEDWWRLKSSVIMTQNQRSMGNGSYGTGRLGVDSK